MFQSLAFTKKYIIALLLIALLSILAYFNLNHLMNKQSNDAQIINISGKQRMLSQQIALYAIYFKTKQLNINVRMMEKSHNFLISLPMNQELKKIYFEQPVALDSKIKEYIEHGKKFYADRNGKSLTYILKHSQLLLPDLDKAVSLYQLESEFKIIELKNNELFILILTLIILLFEAFFIFRPANTVIVKKTKELVDEKIYSDTIIESNTNAIIAVGSDFKVRTYNKSAQKIFGFSKEEMMGEDSLLKIVPSIYKKAHINGLKQFFRTGKFKFDNKSFELTALRKNGQSFPIRISFGANDNRNNRIVIANMQDITDEVDKDAKMLQQSRYAAMGEMIGNIAHQWRQPLSAISTMSSGMKIRKMAGLINDKELIDVFDKITAQTKYLSATIDDFRNFFKQSENETEFFVKDIVKQAITLTEALYKNNAINIILNIKNDSLTCRGKQSELSQVFMNLLNNSKDALLSSGVGSKQVIINIRKNEQDIEIEFYDNAQGIPEHIVEKVFEPYFTTKHKSHGTGIGLFMSKEIIEKHYKGTISIYNKKFVLDDITYVGACFNIKIPSI
mgnify:CR=1 FL=1